VGTEPKIIKISAGFGLVKVLIIVPWSSFWTQIFLVCRHHENCTVPGRYTP